MQRVPRGGLGAGLGQRRQFARRDHLRQHHGGGLQRLDLFLDIGAVGAVLHHQHAERVAGAQDRHAEERVIDFFAGFRPDTRRPDGFCASDRFSGVASLATRPTRPSCAVSTVWWTASRFRPSVA